MDALCLDRADPVDIDATMPTYSATKAALRSYPQSLRDKLRDNTIEVIETTPPSSHASPNATAPTTSSTGTSTPRGRHSIRVRPGRLLVGAAGRFASPA